MKKLIAKLLVPALCLGMLAACAAEGKPSTAGSADPEVGESTQSSVRVPADPVQPQPYVYHWVRSGEETSMNPHQANATSDSDVIAKMQGSLYTYIPAEDGLSARLVPDLAAAEPVSRDGLVWHIAIDPKACWENGEPIDAHTFEYSFKMQLDPLLVYQTGSLLASDFITIQNAQAYYLQGSSNSVAWSDVGIRALDDRTLEIVCDRAQTALDVMRHFNLAYTAPVYQPMYSALLSADGTSCAYGSSADRVLCCGRFRLESWVKGSQVIMVKNDRDLHADWVQIDKVVSRLVTDESTRLELFEKGEADHVSLGTNGLAKYGEDPRVMSYSGTAIETVEVNQNNPDKPWLDDPLLRKALFYAIDRNAIAKLSNNLAAPYFLSVIGQALADGTMYRDLEAAKAIVPANGGYDPDLAKSYMKQVMEKYSLEKLELDLMYTENSDARRLASEYIQNSLTELFGADRFSLSLSAASFANLNATMRSSVQAPTNAWDLCWSAWGVTAEKFFPWRKLERYTTWHSRRYTMYKNSAVDELYAACLLDENRLDENRLVDLTVQLEQAMYDDMTCVPVYNPRYHILFSDRVELPMAVYNPNVGFGWLYSAYALNN